MAIALASTPVDHGPHSVLKVITLNDVDIASVNANTTAEQDLALPAGTLLATDIPISLTKPTAEAGLGIVGFRVKAADTLAVTFVNATGAPINEAEEDGWILVVLRG